MRGDDNQFIGPGAEELDEKLQNFRREIAEIKAQELEMRKKTGTGIHLSAVNPSELTNGDRIIWEALKNNSLTDEMFKGYREEIMAGENKIPFSRLHFGAFVTNKFQNKIFEDSGV